MLRKCESALKLRFVPIKSEQQQSAEATAAEQQELEQPTPQPTSVADLEALAQSNPEKLQAYYESLPAEQKIHVDAAVRYRQEQIAGAQARAIAEQKGK